MASTINLLNIEFNLRYLLIKKNLEHKIKNHDTVDLNASEEKLENKKG